MVPQWDLLNLLAEAAEAAEAEPSFTLRMHTEVIGLLRDGDRVTGVRREVGLKPRAYPVNFDVWWFRLARECTAEFSFLPRVGPGKALAVIPREGYFQIAHIGPKGTDA